MTISSTKGNWVDPLVSFSKQTKRMAALDHDGVFVETSLISASTTARSNKRRRISDASTGGRSENDLIQDDCSCHVEHWAPARAKFQGEEQSPPLQRIQPSKRISFSEKVTTISPPPEVDYSTTTHGRIEPDNDSLFYTEQELLMFAWQGQVQKHAMILTTMVYQEQRRRIAYRIPLLGPSSVLELYHKVVSKAAASEPPAFFREDNRCRRKILAANNDATKGGLDVPTITGPWVKHRLDNNRNTIVARQA